MVGNTPFEPVGNLGSFLLGRQHLHKYADYSFEGQGVVLPPHLDQEDTEYCKLLPFAQGVSCAFFSSAFHGGRERGQGYVLLILGLAYFDSN